ncbi:ornithine decarboxylase [Curtobacterium sp. MCBD17_034]|uniref:aminotransferase class I/II-fold pyridoxal phosphate-dependent enzyme n=1 Tax=unclassified Curtobacterium TaxID=257496 RepID=UPI000DAAD285|nr:MULTISPECIES: ornithine decarboxylase [unclassified Curtobacterium]PZF60906.1 ornithine decarboxylase [Curtobacterium sp. MCBD17_034]PZM40255.1 ornithine decarboxylase [Curtobacterium sp. MCBD17_031]
MSDELDQADAPFLDALRDYHGRDRYGFSPPGHRQGRGIDADTLAVLGKDPFRDDVLESGGLDDRTSSNGYLPTAEALMAQAVHADSVFFSTCGSSLSVKAAMLAVAGVDGGIIMPRDAHKSVTAGLVFSGLQPYWVTPRFDTDQHISHPASPEDYRAVWQEHPDAAGALVVSPTPYGTCADIEGIAAVCHEFGKPLIVDEAWGAHLPFSELLPTWAMNAGADVCVTSVHKMGLGFEQGSVLHLKGDLVDHDHLWACADMLMTTSPNVLIYAAMDGWRRHMVRDGAGLIRSAVDLADRTRDRIEAIDGIHVLRDELLGAEASHQLDPMRMLLDVHELGITGYQGLDWLREHHRIDLGLSDHRHLGIDISVADDAFTTDRLVHGLESLAASASELPRSPEVRIPDPSKLLLESVVTPRRAFFGECENVPAEEAAGRIAAEQATPYPPGVPAYVPGERLTAEVIDYLRSGLEAGMVLPDPTDGNLGTIRVMVE